MTGTGLLKLAVIFGVDFFAFYAIGGSRVAVIVSCALLLFTLMGKQVCLLRDGPIGLERLSDSERNRLKNIQEILAEDVRRISGKDISFIKLYVIPSEDMNAYAYGFSSVAITRGTLNACDDATICSVLAHELSHIMHLDAVISRLIFANITLIIVGLMLVSAVSSIFLGLVFLVFCLLGIAGGLGSVLLFHGTNNLAKGLFSGLQYLVIAIYQIAMEIASRGCEYRADLYSCQLGYGNELQYYLLRFIAPQTQRRRTLNELLYASHPDTNNRIRRIKKYELI